MDGVAHQFLNRTSGSIFCQKLKFFGKFHSIFQKNVINHSKPKGFHTILYTQSLYGSFTTYYDLFWRIISYAFY